MGACCSAKPQKRYDIADVNGDMELEMEAKLMPNDNYTSLKVSMPWAYTHINFYQAQLLKKKTLGTITRDEFKELFPDSKKWSDSELW